MFSHLELLVFGLLVFLDFLEYAFILHNFKMSSFYCQCCNKKYRYYNFINSWMIGDRKNSSLKGVEIQNVDITAQNWQKPSCVPSRRWQGIYFPCKVLFFGQTILDTQYLWSLQDIARNMSASNVISAW